MWVEDPAKAAVSNSQFDVELGARQEDGYQP
jgi:hypothetical protein